MALAMGAPPPTLPEMKQADRASYGGHQNSNACGTSITTQVLKEHLESASDPWICEFHLLQVNVVLV